MVKKLKLFNVLRMDLSDLHGRDGSSPAGQAKTSEADSECHLNLKMSKSQISPRDFQKLKSKVEEISQELLFQLNERDELVNAIQLKNRFIGLAQI